MSNLPLARNRTYIDGVTQIPAGDMNDIQDGIVGAYNGTKSLKAIVVDGVGNTTEAPTAGTILASGKAAVRALEVNATPTDNTHVGAGHVAFAGSGTTIAAQAVGAGTGCSATIIGSDTRGVIALTTGAAPVANATLALITFANPRTGYFGGPFTLLTPAMGGTVSATVSAASCLVSVGPVGIFPNIKVALQSGPTALAAGTTYQWNYLILE